MTTDQTNRLTRTDQHQPPSSPLTALAAPAAALATDNVLDATQTAFHDLVTGPRPLTVDGTVLGCGLPARPVNLAELRDLLLIPGSGRQIRDTAWAELVQRSRTAGPAWVIGCLGVAMPGLVSIARRVRSTRPEQLADDIASEMVTEFVAQLARVDITRPYIAARLLLWANKAALRVRNREIRRSLHEDDQPLDAELSFQEPAAQPEDLLEDAVRQRVITRDAADLIRATRLDGIPMTDYAKARGVSWDALDSQRRRAEARLATAIAKGQISAKPFGSLTDLAP